MTAYALKPWTKAAVPHEDIVRGDFDLSSYAAILGQADVQAGGSEWADETFEASVMIEAAGSKELDRNTYEMTVLMPLEEVGVEITKS